jgi:hypothetical protein
LLQYSINKFQPVAVPVAVIVGSSITKPMRCYSSVGIGFTVTVPFASKKDSRLKVYTKVYSVVVDGDTVIEAVVAPVLHK